MSALQCLAPLVPVLAGVLLACEFRGRDPAASFTTTTMPMQTTRRASCRLIGFRVFVWAAPIANSPPRRAAEDAAALAFARLPAARRAHLLRGELEG